MTSDKIKKYILPYLPYAMIFWFFSKAGEAYRLSPGRDMLQKLMRGILTLNDALSRPLPSFDPFDLCIGMIGAAAVYAIVYVKKKNAKKWRKDVEYGSARWGSKKDIEPYVWECMTEKEREEYHAFLADNEKLFREIANNDRSYKRKVRNIGNSKILEGLADGDEILITSPSRGKKAAPRFPNFLDLIEEAAYHKDGKIHYNNKLIEDIMNSLSDKQREVLELSVIYEISTKAIATAKGCSERNIRKLRERGLHNLCERYAETLKLRASLTFAQREFLEWHDAGKPKLSEPLPAKKSPKQTDPLIERYDDECGPCMTAVSRRNVSA